MALGDGGQGLEAVAIAVAGLQLARLVLVVELGGGKTGNREQLGLFVELGPGASDSDVAILTADHGSPSDEQVSVKPGMPKQPSKSVVEKKEGRGPASSSRPENRCDTLLPGCMGARSEHPSSKSASCLPPISSPQRKRQSLASTFHDMTVPLHGSRSYRTVPWGIGMGWKIADPTTWKAVQSWGGDSSGVSRDRRGIGERQEVQGYGRRWFLESEGVCGAECAGSVVAQALSLLPCATRKLIGGVPARTAWISNTATFVVARTTPQS